MDQEQLTCHWILHNWVPFLSFEVALCTVIEIVFSHIKRLPTVQQLTLVKYE